MDPLALINNVLWHPWVLYLLIGVGLWFTVGTRFGQWKAVRRGVPIVAGKYDSADHPGAITHFQALSAALSATVGVGNIGGTALAIGLGGPGAVFWMWVVGLLGMVLKMVEVTLTMQFRDVSDPSQPKGGPMYVAVRALADRGARGAKLGKVIAGLFCVTLLIATLTGGNFFQAWNVVTVAQWSMGIPAWITGIVMALLVGAVILGGIRRIGQVAGRIVPFMCALYLLAALVVIGSEIDAVPAMLKLILDGAFGGLEGTGAFLGGTMGLAFSIGLQRGLFSNESGQGSSPIAHSAARTDRPVREGFVAGLEPLIDTLIVCTLTALVILLSGIWNRAPDLEMSEPVAIVEVADGQYAPDVTTPPERDDRAWRQGDWIQCVAESGGARVVIPGTVHLDEDAAVVEWTAQALDETPALAVEGWFLGYSGAAYTAEAFDRSVPGLGRWLVTLATVLFAFSTMISWSYYGEKGVQYLCGDRAVVVYKLVFCAVIVVSSLGFVTNTTQLNQLSNIGTGVMLWVNVPLTVFCAPLAFRALRREEEEFDSSH